MPRQKLPYAGKKRGPKKGWKKRLQLAAAAPIEALPTPPERPRKPYKRPEVRSFDLSTTAIRKQAEILHDAIGNITNGLSVIEARLREVAQLVLRQQPAEPESCPVPQHVPCKHAVAELGNPGTGNALFPVLLADENGGKTPAFAFVCAKCSAVFVSEERGFELQPPTELPNASFAAPALEPIT